MEEQELETKYFYITGIVLTCLTLITILILVCFHINVLEVSFPCVVYQKTGHYCPGCGGTRSIKALLQGDILSSLKYHPVIVYILVLGGIFMISNTYTLIKYRKLAGLQMKPLYLILAPVIIFVQWIIKEILLIFFSIHII